MKEIKGDVWELLVKDSGDPSLCITTNGIIRKDGNAVMGRGIALEAAQRFNWIQLELGSKLRTFGNHVHYLGDDIYSFPVKHHWRDKADIELIKRSCGELMSTIASDETVFLPRPGCGNGGLNWEAEVKPAIESLLDDRVIIVSK